MNPYDPQPEHNQALITSGAQRSARRQSRRATERNNYLGQFLVLMAASIFSLCFSFLLVVGSEKVFNSSVEPGYFEVSQDELDKRSEEVSEEIKDMTNRLGFTPLAKQILYRYQPEIFQSEEDPDYLCATHIETEENVDISGCFASLEEKIYLLETPSIESTLAHEFLHAVYQELYSVGDTERLTEVNQLLEEAYQENQEQLESIIGLYYDLHTHNEAGFSDLNRYNELHSWIGVSIEELSPELEEYYEQFFKDRQVILDTHYRDREAN